jgi:5-methylthioadenosine/S-adenosylhomocysteine deaminase
MIRSGTTRFWDMYWQPEQTARAVADAGLRATIGAPLIDVTGDEDGMREAALASLDHLGGLGPAVAPALAPHAIYTVSEDSLRWIAELAAEREVPIHIHLSETRQEVQDCVAAHDLRPAEYLDRLGLLTERTLLAHGVWLDPAELDLVAARGATVVTNPAANMKLAVGAVFPYPAAREAGVAVGLGTDGAGSNDSLDLLADLKLFALAQKHAAADPTAIAAGDAWAVATGSRAPLLGAAAQPLRPGADGDFLLLRGEDSNLAIGELASNLVYAAAGAVVDTTVVAGRVLMRGGELPGLDEIVARARERAHRLGL